MDAKITCVPYVFQWPYFVACNTQCTEEFKTVQCALVYTTTLLFLCLCQCHRNSNCLYKGLHYHTYCILLSNHCRIAPFCFSFTLQGLVPGAAQTERCSLCMHILCCSDWDFLPSCFSVTYTWAQAVAPESHLSCRNSHACMQTKAAQTWTPHISDKRCGAVFCLVQTLAFSPCSDLLICIWFNAENLV